MSNQNPGSTQEDRKAPYCPDRTPQRAPRTSGRGATEPSARIKPHRATPEPAATRNPTRPDTQRQTAPDRGQSDVRLLANPDPPAVTPVEEERVGPQARPPGGVSYRFVRSP